MAAGTLGAQEAPDRTGTDPEALARRVLPLLESRAADIDERAAFPEENLAELRRSGLMGLLVPREHGGLGGSYQDLSRVARALGEACMSTALIWAMHCQQVAAIVDHAGEDLRKQVLPRIAAGEVYVASVTTEKGKGGHLLTAVAPLEPDGDGFTLRREAPIVTGGQVADGFLITMRGGPDAPENDVQLVYADRDQLRLETRSDWNPMGMRGTHSVAMNIEGHVPASNIVGSGGFKDVAISSLVPAGHIAWASCWLGAATGAFRKVVAMLRDPKRRKQFDLDSDLFLSRLSRVRMELATVSAFLGRVTDAYQGLRADPDRPAADYEAPWFQLQLNELKVLAAEQTFSAADHLVELTGLRHGYIRNADMPLERVFRDLRSASLNYGNDRLLVANGRLALLDREVALP